MIGRTVGRYRILAKLGEGGMGSVWKAEDPVLQRTIALKFLPESLAGSTEARQRFLREARAASALQHPGIATVYDVGESGGQSYIAMQLVDGNTLADKLEQSPFDPEDALQIVIAAGKALEHAHEHGVLHRDISARNIMLDRDGQVVVVDFGLAHPEGHSKLTQTGAFMGTVAYVAPEVLQGASADARSDVYSLGVVLYQMLTGRPPFTGDRPEAVMYAALHTEPKHPGRVRESIPPELDAIVLRALAKKPEARYASASEFVNALERLRSGDVDALRTRSLQRKAVPAQLLILATVVLASLATVIFVTRWGRDRGAPETTSKIPRIAVLPLQNLSPESDESSLLLEGIGANLTTKLGKLLGPSVIPWITSRRFADVQDLTEVAKQLRVDALIVGTLRQSGDKLRVSIVLADGKTGVQSWAEEFEENVGDIFTLETLIATSAASKLKGELTGRDEEVLDEPASSSGEAYILYLRGEQAFAIDTREALETAEGHFRAALAIDPNLVLAHVGLGGVLNEYYYRGLGGWGSLEEAEDHFLAAMKIDPSLLSARGGLAHVSYERGQSERCLELGREVTGDDAASLFLRAETLFFSGLTDVSIPFWDRVLAIDPGSIGASWFRAIANSQANLFEPALEAGNEYIAAYGPHPEIFTWMGFAANGLGDPDLALLYYRRAIELFGDDTNNYVFALASWAARDQGDENLQHALARQALDLVDPKLAQFPDNSRLRMIRVWALESLGERDLVMKEVESFLKGEYPYSFAVGNLGFQCIRLGEVATGIRMLRFGIEKGDYHPIWEPELRKYIDRDPELAAVFEAYTALGKRLREKYAPKSH